MTQVIWKHTFKGFDVEETLSIPEDAEFIFTHIQRGEVCVWFRCTPEKAKRARHLYIMGTGCREINEGNKYIGSVITEDQALVFHIFERFLF